MSDERLLSEALRAHAAGGVSTPRADASAPPSGSPATTPGTEGAPTSGRRRFRPLGRVRRPEQTPSDQARPDQARAEQARPDQPRTDQPRTDQPRTDQPRTDHGRPDQPRTDPGRLDQVRPDVPAPRSGGGPGLAPPGYARGPMPPAPPTAPVRPGPAGGYGPPNGPARAYGPARPGPRPSPAATAAPAGYVPWSAVTVTWWSVVAVLAGGVVGGAIGVLSLLLPA